MTSISQVTFALRCDFGDFELPVTSPEHQVQFLGHLSEAFTGFLQELTPAEAAQAEMVQRAINGMARLREVVSTSSCMEENEPDAEVDTEAARTGTSDPGGEAPLPKQKARKVTFNLEQVEAQEYSESSEEEDEEEALHPPRRSPAFILRDVKPHDFQPLLPSAGGKAQRTIPARVRAAMKEVRLGVSRRSQRVCPQ
eukprot:TRINITY_DN34514_c0_g1_i1.p1 TRINITY_DN34514_c0_g1~~TRINITY_DN34514_c0_g1_i1.p1  ORF type:complete len:197 (-),score=38.29 TRINITY_DN34514_c0_g1_i1:18-608(-)